MTADHAGPATGDAAELARWRGRATDPDADRSRAEDGSPEAMARLRARSRVLLRDLLRPHHRRLGGAVALLLAQNAAAMAGPYLVMLGIDRGIAPLRAGDPRPLVALAAAFGLAAVVEYAARRGFLTLSARIGQAVLLELRRRVYDHFLRLSVGFHERYTSGRMVARLTSDLDSIAELVDGGVDRLVVSALSVLTVAGILLWLDPPLAGATLLAFPFLLLLSRWFARSSAAAYRRTREAVALVIVHFVESLRGIRAVQAYRRERRNQRIFEAVNDDYREASLRAFRLIAIFSPGIRAIGNVTVAVVLGYGGARVLGGGMAVGVLAAFLLYLRRFFEPMEELSQFYNSLQSATAALEKLAGVLDEPPGVPEPTRPVPLPAGPGRGGLRFAGVGFGYRADAPVLAGLDLLVPAGQTVALIGPTGAGKSTIAKLVARFHDPVTGTVDLDGVDLRDLADAELRRAVVLVTQENHLFSGSVAENIRFGRPDADDAEIEAAARAIGAHDFIAALPDGYATEVHRRGGRLSAGQRQLVAFARAFLADPRVLILDEATSSLDVPSERLVQRALATVLRDRTALVIAHRLSTVEIADRVLVVDGGRIVEDGSPERLTTADGRYAALHRQWRESLL
ncbi:ABC transporter ATP-binding protein [Micromonospora mirobrigensis]|uniref:ABC-type multidrug transport system, ATPase and permease component n=1 Tax=Micromonospora mirobrigensis TaxID=262898 RepID=A0A1C4XZA0_9ACTN|nr:ABC transporter ATP-binding protein [Micromonospora mirobrigensis]SCF13809.1 ABC-type multidrug transport system, ATPase and permease component [Micromonospora mirobrigensis]